jgi:hypothetical protein
MNTVTYPDIKKVLLCNGGQLGASSPTNAFSLGLRKTTQLQQKEVDKIKDDRDSEFRNKVQFVLPCETLAVPMSVLSKLLALTRLVNIDAEIVLPDVYASGANVGLNQCFKFTNSSPSIGNVGMGLTHETTITEKERVCKVELKTSLPHNLATFLVQAARYANTPHVIWGSLAADDISKYTSPSLVALQYFDGTGYTDIFSLALITTYKFSIKSVGEANIYDQPMNTHYEVSLEVTAADAELDRIDQIMSKDQRIGFSFSQFNLGVEEKFLINPNVLGMSYEMTRGKKSESKMTWKGKVGLSQVAISGNTLTVSA